MEVEAKDEAKGEDLNKVVVDKEQRDNNINNNKSNSSKINAKGEDNGNMLGWMRGRKEWNRTLAYKLKEDRHDRREKGWTRSTI
ncbi:hypothetical protein MLD38_012412 [Melastoma candidum]|nr:hypothetical protein MLD38_012412 [Melastoma candidum]